MPNARALAILTAFGLAVACTDALTPFERSSATGRISMSFGAWPQAWPRDPYVLDSARVSGDSLILAVRHSGGCRTHRYGLVAWNGWLESSPVQVDALLAHDDRDDPCDAVISARLSFDLTPLREAYLSAYRNSARRVWINLSDPSSPVAPALTSVLYEF